MPRTNLKLADIHFKLTARGATRVFVFSPDLQVFERGKRGATVYTARNVIPQALGKVITFLDKDDQPLPEKRQQQIVKLLRKLVWG